MMQHDLRIKKEWHRQKQDQEQEQDQEEQQQQDQRSPGLQLRLRLTAIGDRENRKTGKWARTGNWALSCFDKLHSLSHTHTQILSHPHTHARSDILVAHKMLKAFIVYKGSSNNSPRNESCSTTGE